MRNRSRQQGAAAGTEESVDQTSATPESAVGTESDTPDPVQDTATAGGADTATSTTDGVATGAEPETDSSDAGSSPSTGPAETDSSDAESRASDDGNTDRAATAVGAAGATAVAATAVGSSAQSGDTEQSAPTDGAEDAGRPDPQGSDSGADDETVTVATLPGESDTTSRDEDSSDGEATTASSEASAEGDGATDAKRRTSPLVPILLGAAAVCAALAVWFLIASQAAWSAGGDNEALVDPARTSEVNGQVSDAVEKLFSYDFADTGKTEKAANDLLVGDAVGEYNELFTTVKEQAPIQKLVVTTTVKASGVTQLDGNRAEVLLFVDQNAVRTDNGQDNIGPAQLSVTAQKEGDSWKISQINPR
ncbi:hypothetical protein GIY23_20305 [Allosaccharopolyspora coralli]|uniref:Uncharacterized protein n=1 Tax=Allosaccharopolyspora coralli TaxID=2665642 RepID=A0A5Q3QJ41_9PSEU|nr:hypothetical protein [Allosaccharopolyspora coralli]QGK71545.1 hypothetical protein GIY23_20305 [Allosaccharopolyspora coralli]